MSKRAFITGIVGQDGAYLARFLLQQGYEVYGAYRSSSMPASPRLEELGISRDVRMIPLDLLEFSHVLRTVERVTPDEIYNLAAQSSVHTSFEEPIYTGDVNALGAARLLEAIRLINPRVKFYQASTSEMFGNVRETPQTETTAFYPRSPHGIAKLYAHWTTINYREAFNLFACSGILFNHESPLRGPDFVTRKITIGLAAIQCGLKSCLELGNVDAQRDWGFAGDYVEGMWLILQHKEADDYVLATGKRHSVKDFVNLASQRCGFDLVWEGEGASAQAIDRVTHRTIVKINSELFRPAEVDSVTGDASKARRVLGWRPKVDFEQLVYMMMDKDIERVRQKKST